MPHKHKRRKNDETNIYDLPPTLIAKPLPVRDPNAPKYIKGTGKGKGKGKGKGQIKSKPKQGATQDDKPKFAARAKPTMEDDTPKAFLRLMQYRTRGKPMSALDNGEPNKKRKRSATDAEKPEPARKKNNNNNNSTGGASAPAPAPVPALAPTPAPAEEQAKPTPKPKILPGEKLSDFAARVDREMPISGMKRSGKPGAADMPKLREERRTKHEKHLRRLQEGWRKDEEKIREREAAEREEREAEMEDQLELWKQWDTEAGRAKAKKKGAVARRQKKKGKDGDGVEVDDDPDPWAKLKKRDSANKANPLEVVQAPPQLIKPKEIFKVRGGAKVDVANVPNAVGSLRRREELASERRTIVEEYRRLMAEKRR